MKLYTDALRGESEYRAILDTVKMQGYEKNPHPMMVTGLAEGARDGFYGALAEDLHALCPKKPVLFLLPDEKELLRVQTALSDAGVRALSYPVRDLMFRNIVSSRDYEHERLSVLSAILGNTCDAVLSTPDAALGYTVPGKRLRDSLLTLSEGDTYDPDALAGTLVSLGYVRCDMTDGMGQFAVRGGIFDIYPAFGENPVRIDFFGDEIESMEMFDPLTQRKIEACSSCLIPPAREVLMTPEQKRELVSLITAQKKKCRTEAGQGILDEELEALRGGTDPAFLDKYITFLYPEKECLLSYFMTETKDGLRTDAAVVAVDTQSLSERLHSSEFHLREEVTSLLEDGVIAPKYAEYTRFSADFDYFLSHTAAVLANTFVPGTAGQLSGLFTFRTKHTVSYADSYETLLADVRQDVSLHFRTVLLAENTISAKNLHDCLFDDGVSSVIPEKEPEALADITPGVPVILAGVDRLGFELTDSRFSVRSCFPGERSSYARALVSRSRSRKKKKSAAERILSYADLTVGDYVVHEAHGIGQYMGIETIRSAADGTCRDYIKLKYADSASVFVPCDKLDSVSKYIGARADDGTVKLSRMGGTEWGKAKARVKAAAKEMAKDLIDLYAKRLRRAGYAFAPDDDMQRAFESVFPFEETDSQLQAISEIKADMEKSVPMDRLLCGDVGYGKTEVALRAAMKAAENGKQTAILVPTTILALQHYQTILSRFRGLPVHAEVLSRFRTPKQQEQILRRLRRGEIDIIVGTHRLVSNDVGFHDLGLVIIDEEQRFGVAAKEKLKTLSENVDCLTLTATPIPRTLNMAMSGIRDMSILDEAPGDRVPTQTYVLEYDEGILAEAIKKELRRGGQVFWLHNRVEDIDACAARVSALAPDAAVAVAHGKMDKEEISDIWQKLLDGTVDILISTSIIETGVDVPNANTLIIENSDRMGLSQLHQIRGRIGRSSRRAYAYFTYPKGKMLTEIAEKRLQAIKEYTEFGSGFKIAMRDLELRGAGNLLGAEQHGHMDAIGYDLYIRLLNEAILEEKGTPAEKKTEAVIHVSVDAYIPETYIRSGAQRIDFYKKIGLIETPADRDDIRDELADRFGKLPAPVGNLLAVSYLRAIASRCHIARAELSEVSAALYPERFSLPVWSETARRLGESKDASVKRQPSDLPVSGKYTPFARAAALARMGAEGKKAQTPGTKPEPKDVPIRLTVASGLTPCINVRFPRTIDAISAVTYVIECYEEAEKKG